MEKLIGQMSLNTYKIKNKIMMTCSAELSYDYMGRKGVYHEQCRRKAKYMNKETKAPKCWQHARQINLEGGFVKLDEEVAKKYGWNHTGFEILFDQE